MRTALYVVVIAFAASAIIVMLRLKNSSDIGLIFFCLFISAVLYFKDRLDRFEEENNARHEVLLDKMEQVLDQLKPARNAAGQTDQDRVTYSPTSVYDPDQDDDCII